MRIELDGIGKKYAGWALRDFSLTVEPGRIVAALGLNGAGKTTLLRALGGVVHLDAGRILYDGVPFTRGELELRRRLFFLPDLPNFFGDFSPLRHAAMVHHLYGRGEADDPGFPERVAGHYDQLDLLPHAKAPYATLSRGQRYKAALAPLLAIDPEIWLLDEPFASGMDPAGLEHLKREMRAAAGRGRTVLFSTQLVDLAAAVADELAVIAGGRLASQVTTAALAASGGTGPLIERMRGA